MVKKFRGQQISQSAKCGKTYKKKFKKVCQKFRNDIARKGGESSTTVSRLDYVTYIYRWMTLSIVFLHTLFVYTVLDLYFVQYNQ